MFVRPGMFDAWLPTLDHALASLGATRGRATHGNVKTSARLLWPSERAHEFLHTRTRPRHCHCNELGRGHHCIGSRVWLTRAHQRLKVGSPCRLVASCATPSPGWTTHPQVVLTRQRADVSKLKCHMSVNGDVVDHDMLASFDGHLRSAVSASVWGGFLDHSRWQATTGVASGGLGICTALSLALPSFVASRITSKPLVRTKV